MKQEQIAELISALERFGVKNARIELDDVLIRMEEGKSEIYKLQPIEEKIPAKKEEKKEGGEVIEIKAPSAGIFYRRPDPNSPPYVEVGSLVEPGDTLALIEVMKSFGPVVSEVKGEIIEILVEDETPVEYGQILFLIRRSK